MCVVLTLWPVTTHLPSLRLGVLSKRHLPILTSFSKTHRAECISVYPRQFHMASFKHEPKQSEETANRLILIHFPWCTKGPECLHHSWKSLCSALIPLWWHDTIERVIYEIKNTPFPPILKYCRYFFEDYKKKLENRQIKKRLMISCKYCFWCIWL